jgi:hypothetical protein
MQFAVAAASARRENALCYNRAPFNQTQQSFSCLFYFPSIRGACVISQRDAQPKSGGEMSFEETLFLRDDEMDEFGDSGAYGDSLEEDYEEEEEEEEAEVPGGEALPEPVVPPAPTPSGGGGGGGKPARKPPRKAARKAAPRKKAAKKKAAKKKPARKAAKRKPARKKAAGRGKKSSRRRR